MFHDPVSLQPRNFYRRNDGGNTGIHSDSSQTQLYGQSANVTQTPDFYGHTDVSNDSHWQPGETLPIQCNDVVEDLKKSFHSMISTMQAGISVQFENIQESIKTLNDRVDSVESQVHIGTSPHTPTSLPTCSSGSELEASGGKNSHRRISLEMQVCLI